MFYHFGAYTLDTDARELCHAGMLLKLQPKVFQVLAYLIQHRDRLVTKQELLETLWPNEFVVDVAVARCIATVRQALGDRPETPQYIQTWHRQGYRFIATVTEHSERPPEEVSPARLVPCAPTESPSPLPDVSLRETPPLQVEESTSLPVSPGSSPLGPPPLVGPTWGGERKLVTILCGAFANLSVLVKQHGIEHLQRELEAISTRLKTTAERYGGIIHVRMEDRFVLLFGTSLAQEDHAQRAIFAACDLHQHLRARQGKDTALLQLRIGVHTGEALVERQRTEPSAMRLVLGDTLALATRIQYRTAPGAIWISETTARLVQQGMRIEAVGSILVEGTAAPVPVYQVQEPVMRNGFPGAFGARPLSRLVGREGELALLHRRLDQAQCGQGHVVILVGEPGIGKSRLMYEFWQEVKTHELSWLAGRCQSYGSTIPYLPVLELLRQACGITREDPPAVSRVQVLRALQAVEMEPEAWIPVLLHLLGVSDDTDVFQALSPQVCKTRTFEALSQLFLRRSQQHPLLLMVENLHWIDATSEEFLTNLVERLARSAILLVVTVRPGYRLPGVEQSYVTQLALQPLTVHESRQVVQRILGRSRLRTPVIPHLLAHAEGNPFFLEELAWTVREQEIETASLVLPETVQAVVAARIDRLPPEAKRLLQVATIIGPEVPFALLQAVTDLPEEILSQELQRLQTAELLYETHFVPERLYTFKHTLTREVAYQSLLQHTRQQYHQRIAQVLEAQFLALVETQPELLAYHHTEAGLSEQAVVCWQQASQRAIQRSASTEAIAHLTKGLEVLKTLPDTPARTRQELLLRLSLGNTLIATKGYAAPEVEATYARAWELCQQIGETPQLFEVLCGLRTFYAIRPVVQTAGALGEQLLILAQRTHDPARLLMAHYAIAYTLFFRGKFAAAYEHLKQASALYDPQQHRSDAFFWYGPNPEACLAFLARALWYLGYPDQALERNQEALLFAQELAYPFSIAAALCFTARIHLLRREWHLAQEQANRAITLSTEHGFVHYAALGRILQGRALVAQGQAEEGIAQLRQGITTYRVTGSEHTLSNLLALLAESYDAVGQVEEGLTILDEALVTVDRTGERYYESELYRLKGELLLQSGVQCPVSGVPASYPALNTSDLEAEAATCFHRALDIARRQQAKSLELRAALSLSRLWQRQGKHAHAHQVLSEIYTWFTEGFDTADLKDAKALLDLLSSSM